MEYTWEEFCKLGIGSNNYRNQMISMLKKHDKTIILYGAGEIAKRVSTLLERESVLPDYQIVDSEYENIANYRYTKLDWNRIVKLDNVCLVAGMRDYLHVAEVAKQYGTDAFFFDVVFDTEVISRDFFKTHINEFYDSYKSLNDELSHETMIAYIKSNIERNPTYLFPVWDRGEQYFSMSQVMVIGSDETFVNCGAYTGDTVKSFMEVTAGKYRKIYAIEADRDNFLILNRNDWENVEKINKAVYSNSKSRIKFSSSMDYSRNMTRGMSRLSASEEAEYSYEIETCTIDEIVGNGHCSFINMDIEGAELQALKGGEVAIRKNRPKLAISCYHKSDDLIALIDMIKTIDSEYVLDLRAYCPWSEELVLFAYHPQ